MFTILWIGGAVGERLLREVDKWNIDIFCNQAGRADLMFILNHPLMQRVLEVSQLIIDLKEGGAKGHHGLSNMREAGVQDGLQKAGVGRKIEICI